MTNGKNTNIQTVKVPDWLKEHYDGVTVEYNGPSYKKLADMIKDNSFLSITFKDLSDETLNYAATVYSDDFYSIDPWEQQMRLDDIRDWIVALIEGGVVSVSPQSTAKKPFWNGTVLTGRYEHEINEWAGAAASYKKSSFAYYAEIPPLGDEDAN